MSQWREAAQTVPLRGEGRAWEAFMIRRRAGLRAFPGVWAFPGGSLEPADLEAAAASGLSPDPVLRWFQEVEQGPLLINQTAFVAWAGPRLADTAGVQWPALTDWPLASLASIWTAVRELREETGFALPERDAWRRLGYVGRLSTPPAAPARFHSRFFLLRVPPGAVLLPPEAEAQEGEWLAPEDVLTRDLPLAPPTRYLLERLRAWTAEELWKLTAKRD
jgi:8-oxo-dGTP pyrophosphatase MutT (NUDIX family)